MRAAHLSASASTRARAHAECSVRVFGLKILEHHKIKLHKNATVRQALGIGLCQPASGVCSFRRRRSSSNFSGNDATATFASTSAVASFLTVS